jgi:hypothetical protein
MDKIKRVKNMKVSQKEEKSGKAKIEIAGRC